ncbi:hypothetical protein BT69DRAFT_1234015 [Atractiella rhizophila]|nr:hypothetical protein BT69DRAFT_1234015 [Atractiella rhizophila]
MTLDQHTSSSSPLIEFMHILENLKTTKRAGWVREGVKEPESISDHMHRMSILCLLSERTDIDISKCVLFAVVHDLAEATVGDITPADGISREEKMQRERSAMQHYSTLLPKSVGDRLFGIWEEYERMDTPEARFVKDIDRFELLLQTVEYEKKQGLKHLNTFWDSTVGKVENEETKKWTREL